MAANLEELGNLPDDQVPPASQIMPAVLEGMVANVAEAAKSHAGTTVGWKFDDGSTYHISIGEGGTATWGEGTGESPRLTFVTSAATWVKMIAGKIDGMQAFMTGKLKIEGDMMFAQQFQTLFNNPASAS
jgi:putative sterol carrier protein